VVEEALDVVVNTVDVVERVVVVVDELVALLTTVLVVELLGIVLVVGAPDARVQLSD